MSNDDQKKSKTDAMLKHVKKHRLKYIAILPSLITLTNAVFGFSAIVFASRGSIAEPQRFLFQEEVTCFSIAGYMIFLAMLADMLDGRVARMSKSTSSFGGQLDSLCDIISFGIAPVFLMLKVLESKMHDSLGPMVSDNFFARFVWLSAAVYIGCAAIRLARFNVENEQTEAAHMSFWGLPCPAAAGVIASLIIFQQDLLPKLAIASSDAYQLFENALLYCLPLIAIGIAVLMISRIRYSHVFNQYLKGRKPFAYLIWGFLGIGLIVISNLPLMLVLSFCGFAISGFAKWAYYKVILKKDYYKTFFVDKPAVNKKQAD